MRKTAIKSDAAPNRVSKIKRVATSSKAKQPIAPLAKVPPDRVEKRVTTQSKATEVLVQDDGAEEFMKQMVLPEECDVESIQPLGFSSSKFAAYKDHFVIKGLYDFEYNALAMVSNSPKYAGAYTIGAVTASTFGTSGNSHWMGQDQADFITDSQKKDFQSPLTTGDTTLLFPRRAVVPSGATAGNHMGYYFTTVAGLAIGAFNIKTYGYTGLSKGATMTTTIVRLDATLQPVAVHEVIGPTQIGTDGTETQSNTVALLAATNYFFIVTYDSNIPQDFQASIEVYSTASYNLTIPNIQESCNYVSVAPCVGSSSYQITGASCRFKNTTADIANSGSIVSSLCAQNMPEYGGNSTSLFQYLSRNAIDYFDGAAKDGAFVSWRAVDKKDFAPGRYDDRKLFSRKGFINADLGNGSEFLWYFHFCVVHYGRNVSYTWKNIPYIPYSNRMDAIGFASCIWAAAENPSHKELALQGLKTAASFLWKHKKALWNAGALIASASTGVPIPMAR